MKKTTQKKMKGINMILSLVFGPNWQGDVITNRTAVTDAGAGVSSSADLTAITTPALTTAAGASATAIVLTNTAKIVSGCEILVSTRQGTGTTGAPVAVASAINTTNGTVALTVTNTHGSAALNGTVVIDVRVVAPIS